MARHADSPSHDPERRRNGDRRGSQRASAAGQARRGMSGYGMDSIRRELRVQLEQRRLLRPGPLPGEEEDKDDGPGESS